MTLFYSLLPREWREKSPSLLHFNWQKPLGYRTSQGTATASLIANKKKRQQAWLAHSILWRPDKGLPAVTREILSCHWSKVWKIGKLFPWETCVQSSIRWWHKKFNPSFGCYASTWGKREKQGQSVAKLHKQQQVCNYHSFAFLLLPTFSSYFVDFESKLESPLPLDYCSIWRRW